MVKSMIVCAAALSLLLSAPAAAQDSAASAFAKGKRLFKQRQYVEAISSFEQAYRLRPHFMVKCSIARCYQAMNDFILAAKYYRRCLSEGASKQRKARRIKRALAAVKRKIAKVQVLSPGEGGTIVVDGQVLGRAPGTVPVNPGQRVVEVRRDGARPASTKVRLKPGQKLKLTLVPETIEKPVPAAVPPTPTESTPPPAVPSPATPTPQPVAPKRSGLSQVWFWSAAALTAALAAATVAFGVRTLGLRDDYNDQPTKSALDDFAGSRTLTNVFVALTAVAAAGGTTLFFFTDFGGGADKESDDVSEATVWGVGVRGTF